MIRIDSADKPKTILLLTATVAVFGFAAYRVIGMNAAPTPSDPTPQPDSAAPAVSNSLDNGGRAQTLADTGSQPKILLPANEVAPNVNPFRDVLGTLPKTHVVQSGSATPNRSTIATRPAPVGEFTPPALPGALPAGMSLSQEPLGGHVAIEPVHPEAPQLRLRGVLTGRSPVAVLDAGGHTEVLHLGEMEASGYRVVAIGSNSVTLRRGAEKVNVRFGLK